MYELIGLTAHDYYIDCPAKIGLVTDGQGNVVAIDSGNSKDAAKKALRHIEAQGWHLQAVFNTHSHADHIGGNRFLQERTGCRVFARDMECAFTNFPLLEPMSLYGGFPPADLRHRFLLAEASTAEPLNASVLPSGWQMVDLPGHCFAMTGFVTPDGTFFSADVLTSEEALQKYGIGYQWDLKAHLQTLQSLASVSCARTVPSHAPVCENAEKLIQANISAVEHTASVILSACREPATFENILQQVFARFAVTADAVQYALIGSTVRSYLAYLQGEGKVSFFFEDGLMLWKNEEA